mmetsp:Transcript_59662/g.172804  ORF Transcript_59662/g.172804 Transcript_59662/m.172804 type:complete len:230 (-) Transcript_59662:2262-2951(-)
MGCLLAAQRRLVDRERHHHRPLAPLAAHDRPAAPGQQIHQEYGQGHRDGLRRLQDERQQLPPNPGARDPVRQVDLVGEHRDHLGSRAGAGVAAAEGQRRVRLRHQARRQVHQLCGDLQVLHDHDTAEPALLAGGLGEGHAAELRHHPDGPRGPDAWHRRGERAPGLGGAEEPIGEGERQDEQAVEGHRGRDPAPPLHLRGRCPRGRYLGRQGDGVEVGRRGDLQEAGGR